MPLTVILYGENIITTQANYWEILKTELESKNITVIMAQNLGVFEVGFTNALELSSVSLNENSYAIFDTENKIKLLDYKNNLNQKYNWIETFAQFFDNYTNLKPDGNYWRWGQVVQEDGEYLCQDCGYIEEFQKGQIFGVCESCNAGEPSGDSTPENGFWEKL